MATVMPAGDGAESQTARTGSEGAGTNHDEEETRHFLRLLDPNAGGFTFQTFDDDQTRKNPVLTSIIQTPPPARDRLLSLNGQGAGIFVTINETDGKGRKTENITRIRAVWQEDDCGFDGAFPLAPSMIVQTSPGHFHRYWLIADDWPADEQGCADFKAVMDRMADSYGSDKNAKDSARVLRLPGFLHRKGNPHLVHIVEAAGHRYIRAEILAAFPPVEPVKKTHGGRIWTPQGDDGQRIRSALYSINSDDRSLWLQCGMAIKDHFGDSGRSLWDDWSRRSEKYDERDQERTWKSFRGNGIAIGTLFYHAQQGGWRDERRHQGPDYRGFEGFERSQGSRFSASEGPQWREPKPLPNGLSPVDAFDIRFLPDAIAPWVMDIASRLQCPPDYVAVAGMVALGATIGRRVGIKPQMRTDWIEVPNLWGAFVGRPGWLKSPAMGEALKPLHHLEAQAIKNSEAALQVYLAELETFKTRQQVRQSLEKEALKKDPNNKPNSGIDLGDEPRKPPNIRYRTNDSSYESLGELLIDNPAGLLVERDELVSLLRHLDREDQSVARGFYLSSWSGTQPYTFDRIGRGHRHIEAVCLSVLGNTQPARISEYVRRANRDGAGGDGLIQRFGLLVWPDASPDWKNVDEYPDSVARENAWAVFERASVLDSQKAIAMGASQGRFDKVPAFHFDEAALAEFEEFRAELERRVRSGELSPAFEGHIAKYRKLVPALALINHIADSSDGPIAQKSLLRALAFMTYLESHARRVYGSTSESELAAAKAILKHVQNGDLQEGFTARDIHQRGWAHLTEREHVGAGLDLLVDLYYLAEMAAGTGPKGGRPRVTYSINPRIVP
jgi:Protein of unknown function (DUF3987)/Primase C terminal 2 (PriCT-2)/RepB DNA-primase from phage plasmid